MLSLSTSQVLAVGDECLLWRHSRQEGHETLKDQKSVQWTDFPEKARMAEVRARKACELALSETLSRFPSPARGGGSGEAGGGGCRLR